MSKVWSHIWSRIPPKARSRLAARARRVERSSSGDHRAAGLSPRVAFDIVVIVAPARFDGCQPEGGSLKGLYRSVTCLYYRDTVKVFNDGKVRFWEIETTCRWWGN